MMLYPSAILAKRIAKPSSHCLETSCRKAPRAGRLFAVRNCKGTLRNRARRNRTEPYRKVPKEIFLLIRQILVENKWGGVSFPMRLLL